MGSWLDMVRIKDGSDETVHDSLSKIFVERVGIKHNEIMRAPTFDRASKGIVTMLNHDEDFCDPHDCDNIGRSAIGDLITNSNKVK